MSEERNVSGERTQFRYLNFKSWSVTYWVSYLALAVAVGFACWQFLDKLAEWFMTFVAVLLTKLLFELLAPLVTRPFLHKGSFELRGGTAVFYAGRQSKELPLSAIEWVKMGRKYVFSMSNCISLRVRFLEGQQKRTYRLLAIDRADHGSTDLYSVYALLQPAVEAARAAAAEQASAVSTPAEPAAVLPAETAPAYEETAVSEETTAYESTENSEETGSELTV